MKLIYNKVCEGTIKTSPRIVNLAEEYHKLADLSKKQHKDIENDFIIVASACVGGVKTILSLNRKTMASDAMIKVYDIVNPKNNYKTPKFLTTRDALSQFLKLL